nr:hypothetical protein [Paracoccus mutanolyticus]
MPTATFSDMAGRFAEDALKPPPPPVCQPDHRRAPSKKGGTADGRAGVGADLGQLPRRNGNGWRPIGRYLREPTLISNIAYPARMLSSFSTAAPPPQIGLNDLFIGLHFRKAVACLSRHQASDVTNSKPVDGCRTVRRCFLQAGFCRSRESWPYLVAAMAAGKASGRPRSSVDTIIAAVAEANDCIVVTDNEKDFFDTEIVNPIWDGDGGRI